MVGCEKSLYGTYVNQKTPAFTLVIAGDKIQLCWTVDGETTIDDEGTFTREGDVLITTLTYTEHINTITITRKGYLTYENGDNLSTYVKLDKKPK